MTDGIIKTILEGLKLAPRYLIAIGLVAGLILFGGTKFQETLGLPQFAKDHRAILGILFLSSIVLLLVAIGGGGLDRIKRLLRERKFHKGIIKRLQRLTEDEKQILRYYIAKDTRSNMLSIEDGVVQGLVSDRIIYRSASLGNMREGFAHNICDFVWDYLDVYPETLNGSTNTYRTGKRERFGY
jgi:hypothetical protein